MAATMIESFFQRSLEDLVKGLRMQMIGEARYISKALDEIRKEIKSTDPNTKAVALQKLTYLHMLQGVDMAWASFHVVEVMSMQKFSWKKLGYLAASQSFHYGTDVLLLIPNLMRKDLGGKNEYESSLVIECLSRVATPDLARELTPELFTILASGRVFLRKKATLALLRLFIQYPDAIRVAFKRLVEKLDDPDSSVVSAAVSVICELAVKDPKPYLPLAPEFYKLLLSSSNNWLSIKLVKIFSVLTPLEPRLGKKIVEPLCDIIRKTGAKSLLLECIQTVTLGLTDHSVAVKLCAEKLRELMGEDDMNLKYLGLRALAALMPVHPWAVAENKEVIVKCLNDADPSIQTAALLLIMGMVSESNVVDTVEVLLQYVHITDQNFCNELVAAILSTCSRGLYDLISDFPWYVTVLGKIARIPHCEHGMEIGRQLIDISLRVNSVTNELLKTVRSLLLDPTLLGLSSLHDVLSAAAWIAGEYVAYSQNPYELIEAFLQPKTKLLPSSVRAIYLQGVFKVFIHYAASFYPKCVTVSNVSTDRSKLKRAEQGPLTTVEVSPVHSELECPAEKVCEELKYVSTSSVAVEMKTDEAQEGTSRIEEERLRQQPTKTTLDDTLESMNKGKEDGADSDGRFAEEIDFHKLSGFSGLLKDMTELIVENVSPLKSSLDVEVQERACNILGLLKFLQETPRSSFHEHNGPPLMDMLDALKSVFAVQLGPVSAYAQGRVVAPEGLVLDNLDALGPIDSHKEFEGLSKKEGLREWEEGVLFVSHHKVSAAEMGEGAALLAQHRQRHGNFYLANDEKLTTNSLDYPPPLIAQGNGGSLPSTSTSSAIKFPESSLVSNKGRRTKVRPVVVKLDDDEDSGNASLKLKKKDLKDEFISSAIRDVLAGDSRLSIEVKESLKVRQHRPRGPRISRHSVKETASIDRLSSSRVHDRSGLEKSAVNTGKDDGKVSQMDKNSARRSKHRHSRHEQKRQSDSGGEDNGVHALRSPQRHRGTSKHAGHRKTRSPIQKPLEPVSVPDLLL